MKTQTEQLHEYLELVNLFPSPHNGQPIRLKPTSDNQFEVYFQKERGLQSNEISYIFSFVSMGVFMEHVAASGRALGHAATYELSLPTESDLKGEGVVKFADLKVEWDVRPADSVLEAALRFRQTSRKKYFEGIDATVIDKLTQIATAAGMKLTGLPDDKKRQAIWLNQRAVFDDLFDKPVNAELDKWLRYTQAEKTAKQDGLAYDCMELNGALMKFLIQHPGILRAPVVSRLLEKYYLRTMDDDSDVFYMMAPFGNNAEAFAVGTVIMLVWAELSLSGDYLHPFGTIMSNHAAHQDFMKLAGVTDESQIENYLVFIFRAGKSKPPVRSLRLPYQNHLVME